MEWVGARSAGGCARTEAKPSNKTVTPSDRELRLRQRTKRIEEQAADAKLATERAIGSMIKQSHEVVNNSDKNRNPQTQVNFKTNRKMSSSTQPDSHHRVDQNLFTYQLPLSLDSGLRDESINTDYCHLMHPTRVSNTSETEKK